MSGARSSTSSPSGNSRWPSGGDRVGPLDRGRVDFGESGETLKVKNLDHSISPDGTWRCSPRDRTPASCTSRAPRRRLTVIDNSSLYRMDPDVPLIVPG